MAEVEHINISCEEENPYRNLKVINFWKMQGQLRHKKYVSMSLNINTGTM